MVGWGGVGWGWGWGWVGVRLGLGWVGLGWVGLGWVPPHGDPAKSRQWSRRRAAATTRDASRAAVHHARMRNLVVLARLPGRYPPQCGAYNAHGTSLLEVPRWPSAAAWTTGRVRSCILIAAPDMKRRGGGDGSGVVDRRKGSGVDYGGSEDGGGDAAVAAAALLAGRVERRGVVWCGRGRGRAEGGA